ncbi:MAG: gephyrin-like molybdotransferase Glp [Brooklawnia sp.]|uniref:molybdopterin-binding protein n=1 Tax=Brooklawnia sp. TaxID=2699740 RepID=UPI003C7689D4
MRLFTRRAPAPESVEEPPQVVEPELTLPDPPPVDDRGRRTVAAQREYLLSLVEPLPAFGMYLLDAWGTAVCEDIVADTHAPAEDLVAVNGFAVRAQDLTGLEADATATLRLRDDYKVSKVGSAVRVRAGQLLPEGADAVIPADQARLDGNVLTVHGRVSRGSHVRWIGSDVRIGVPIMRSGERLDARRSAMLAMAGIDRVLARPRPRVVVLSVADQASDPSDVESHLIAAAARADGAQVWRVGLPVSSDRELRDAISDQLIRADIVVVSGTLAPDGQLVRVVRQLGDIDLTDIALEPSGGVGFSLVGEDQVPMVMLPDDPVEAYVGYQFFIRPLVRRLAGAPVVNSEQVNCLAGADLPGGLDVVQVRFGTIREQQGERVVVPLGNPSHPRLADLVGADAMIVLDEESASVQLGDRVGCWLLDD